MWKAALDALVESAHVVLMDLRSFGPENQGVRYEIEALAHHGAMGRTVFLVDQTTDTDLLNGLLARVRSEPTIIEHTTLRDVDDLVKTCVRLAATDGGRR